MVPAAAVVAELLHAIPGMLSDMSPAVHHRDGGKRVPRASREPESRSCRSAVGAAVASLLILGACGGSDAQRDADAGSASASAESRATVETHSHEGGEEHSHDEAGAHTHPADTLASDLALNPDSGGSWSGSVTVLAVGDSLRVLVSLAGATSGSRHPIELVAGGCQDPGSELASLTPVAAGRSGEGSSQTTVPSARLGDHAHGAVRVMAGNGSVAACAPVHLSTGHSHE